MKKCEYEKWGNGAASPLSLWVPLSRNEDNGRSPFNENPAKKPLLYNQHNREKSEQREMLEKVSSVATFDNDLVWIRCLWP